jgi:hypothetical protein
MECALQRQTKGCKAKFGSATCCHCKYYIASYVNAEPRHINLFMMEAEREVAIKLHTVKHNNTMAAAPVLVVLAFVALLVVVWIRNERMADRIYKEKHGSPTTALTKQDDVWITMEKVAVEMRRKVDVNHDGLTNCIDAAILFYQYFPDKSRVTIELNYNPTTNMNHLFNCVLVNGFWRAIEPQARFKGWSQSYWMADVWGKEYDRQYNFDETDKWKKYAK